MQNNFNYVTRVYDRERHEGVAMHVRTSYRVKWVCGTSIIRISSIGILIPAKYKYRNYIISCGESTRFKNIIIFIFLGQNHIDQRFPNCFEEPLVLRNGVRRAPFVTPQKLLKLYVIENEYIFHEDLNAIIHLYL